MPSQMLDWVKIYGDDFPPWLGMHYNCQFYLCLSRAVKKGEIIQILARKQDTPSERKKKLLAAEREMQAKKRAILGSSSSFTSSSSSFVPSVAPAEMQTVKSEVAAVDGKVDSLKQELTQQIGQLNSALSMQYELIMKFFEKATSGSVPTSASPLVVAASVPAASSLPVASNVPSVKAGAHKWRPHRRGMSAGPLYDEPHALHARTWP